MSLYLGLIHHPIKDKKGEIITTSVTNLDIHDIARSCRTFKVKKYFIVTPILAQQALVKRITGHWEKDRQASYNPDRFNALSLVSVQNDFLSCIDQIEKEEKESCFKVATGANFNPEKTIKVPEMTKNLDTKPVFLLFGTGWGLHDTILEKADAFLEPIFGCSKDGYNHLSVRSAVAIYLNQISNYWN